MNTFEYIASKFLKLPEAEIVDTLTPKDVPDWDSMNYLLFVADLEKEYQVSFTMDEVLSADSLGALRKSLQKKGVAV